MITKFPNTISTEKNLTVVFSFLIPSRLKRMNHIHNSTQTHRETDRFFTTSGVQVEHSTSGLFHFRHTTFSGQLETRVNNILEKSATLRVNLNLDGTPITSRTHTHPWHSQTSRLLISFLSLGVPVPPATQCLLRVNRIFGSETEEESLQRTRTEHLICDVIRNFFSGNSTSS